jgi:hypothetical protein
MTQRDWQTSGGGTELARRPTSVAARVEPNGNGTPHELGWDQLFQNASPAVRAEWLALARSQGVLYAQQMAAACNGNGDGSRPFFERILAGHIDDLEPLRTTAVLADGELDVEQKVAVTNALATPDVYLIDGAPGTGRSRVAATIAREAARCGERVLLVAPAGSTIDPVLRQLTSCDDILALRCLARDERLEQLPDDLRALTLADQTRRLRDRLESCAVQEVKEAEIACQRWQDAAVIVNQLAALDADRCSLQQRLRQHELACSQLPSEVEQAASRPGDLADAIAELERVRGEVQTTVDAALATLEAKRAEQTTEQASLIAQVDRLRPLVEVKQQGQWWKAAWWRAIFQGDVVAAHSDLETRIAQARLGLDKLDEEVVHLQKERNEACQNYAASRAQLIEAEVGRRRAEMEGALSEAQAALAALESRHNEIAAPIRELGIGTDCTNAVSECRLRLEEAQSRRDFARDWAAAREEVATLLIAQMPGLANVVAGTTASVLHDEHFGESARHGKNFDLLIIDDADLLTDSEFFALTRRARRCVLIGLTVADAPTTDAKSELPPESTSRSGPRRSRNGTSHGPVRSQVFQRLYRALHCDPWVKTTEGRLTCRFRPVVAEQRRWLESERVADAPDVELRILATPRMRPHLAEVVFPPVMSLAQAKTFLFRDLQELPVRGRGQWLESPECIVLQLTTKSATATQLELEPGVREVAEADGSTVRIEFDKALGWTSARAIDWAERHLSERGPGRTTRLTTTYRVGTAAANGERTSAAGSPRHRHPPVPRSGEGAAP